MLMLKNMVIVKYTQLVVAIFLCWHIGICATTTISSILQNSHTNNKNFLNLPFTRYDVYGKVCKSLENRTNFTRTDSDFCLFSLYYGCLVDNLLHGHGTIFVYLEDTEKYQYALQNHQREHLYIFQEPNETNDNLIAILRSFVISVIQSTAESVITFVNDSTFELLLNIWIQESDETMCTWLRVKEPGVVQMYAPKCIHPHYPTQDAIEHTQMIENGVCKEASFENLNGKILRCLNHKTQPPITAVVRLEAPWVITVTGFYNANGRISCQKSIPCSIPNKKGNNITWTESCCAGSMVEIFLEIAENANIKQISMYGVPDEQYGVVVSCPGNNQSDPAKCKWSGLFNELIQKRADIAVTGLSWNYARAVVSDIPGYIGTTPFGIVRHKTIRNLPLLSWQFVETLHPKLAIAILVTFLFVYIALFVIENVTNLTKKRPFYPVHETLSYLSGLLFQRDLGGRNPYFWAARVPSLWFALATTIIMTTYTADLTAKGVFQQESDFKGVKDERILNPSSEFLYSLPMGTNIYNIFINNIDKRLRKSVEYMKPYHTKNDVEGFEKVYTKTIDAYISDHESMTAVANLAKYCSTLVLESFNDPKPYSFALQKGSKFTPLFTKHIAAMKASGKINTINKKWLYKTDTCAGAFVEAKQFTWRYGFGLALILICTSLICCVLLIVEILISRYRRRKTAKI